jgi:hypothetical protein
MNKHTTTIGLFALLFLNHTVNAAAPDILPGLWENKVEIKSESGQFEKAMEQAKQMLENMPAEQQKMMKDMMAKQGVNFDFANRTMQVCMTQKNIDDFAIPQTDEDCSQSFEEKAKNHYIMKMQCANQNMSGQGDFIIKDNKHYTGTVVMDMDMNGQKDTMTMKQEGTWKSNDCGDITPE